MVCGVLVFGGPRGGLLVCVIEDYFDCFAIVLRLSSIGGVVCKRP